MISLGVAAALNSCAYMGAGVELPSGWREVDFIEDQASGVAMGHYANGEQHYLAVRGTWGSGDIMPALRVFLGADPVDRILFLQGQIMERFGGDPDPSILAVGGHSLGGLIAAAAAERFGLAGLAQNSPGWMTRVPEAGRMDKFLQVRTARDVVADWGSAYPRNLLLPDTSMTDWSFSALHNLERQNQLIADHGIGHFRVDDQVLAGMSTDPDCACPGTPGARLSRALEKLRAGREYTHLHHRLAARSKL